VLTYPRAHLAERGTPSRRSDIAGGETPADPELGGHRVAPTGIAVGGGPAPEGEEPLVSMLRGTLALIDSYTGTLTVHPSLSDQLRPLLDEHRVHATALRGALADRRPVAGPNPADDLPPVSPDEAAALGALFDVETAATAEAVRHCLAARARDASLLGSIAASRACHLELLTPPSATSPRAW
jgi:hypothetical protein